MTSLLPPVITSSGRVMIDQRVSPATLSRKLSEWWRGLGPWGTEKKGNYFSPNKVPTISTRFPCPDTTHTIRSIYETSQPINGSRIKFGDDTYQIGQSPIVRAKARWAAPVETYSDAIGVGLETAQGVIQIVSDKTHQQRDSRDTLVGMLQAKLNENDRVRIWHVAIRQLGCLSCEYRDTKLMGIDEVPQNPSQADNNFRQYILRLQLYGDPSHKLNMPITQIGMPFENSTLKAQDIKRASTIAFTHHENLRKRCYPDDSQRPFLDSEKRLPKNLQPLILSKFGHGRSATVVTYKAVSKLIHEREITTEREVQHALMKAIEHGRAARPHFVHSYAQVEQLRTALVEELKSFLTERQRKRAKMQDSALVESSYEYYKKVCGFDLDTLRYDEDFLER